MLQCRKTSQQAMEADTIQKNEASSKSQTSRINLSYFRTIKKVVILLTVVIGLGLSADAQAPNARNNANQIEGVWKYVVADDPSLEIKCIITKGHWVVTYIRANIVISTFGGTYSFDGETYIDKREFWLGSSEKIIGTWKIRFEGNKMHKSGTISTSERNYYEIWERVK